MATREFDATDLIAQAKSNLESGQSAAEDAENQAQSARTYMDDAASTLDELEQGLANLVQENEEGKERIEELENEKEQLADEKTNLERDLNALGEEKDKLEAQVRDLEARAKLAPTPLGLREQMRAQASAVSINASEVARLSRLDSRDALPPDTFLGAVSHLFTVVAHLFGTAEAYRRHFVVSGDNPGDLDGTPPPGDEALAPTPRLEGFGGGR